MDADEAFRRFAEGDGASATIEAALPEFYRRLSGSLFKHHVYGQEHEDLAQEVIVRVLRNREKLCGRGVASVCSWLQTVCKRLWLDRVKRRRTSGLGELDPARPPAGDGGLQEALELCTKRLPEPYRAILELRHTADWPAAEIAELYGKSSEWCWQKLQQAKHVLRECLRKHGYDVSE